MVKTNYAYRRNNYSKPSAVKKIITKKRRQPVVVNKNKTIIANAKAVNLLMNAVNGHVQRNYQVASLSTVAANLLTPMQPYAFCLNDFTQNTNASNLNGGIIFKPTFSGTAPNIIPQSVKVGNWENRSPQETQGLAPAYRTWRDQNINTVSPRAYQPLYAEYSFTFNRESQDLAQQTMWVRVDTLRRKRIYTNTTINAYQMPDILGAFTNMANKNDAKVQNAYNPALFHVKTRWLKLPQMDVSRKNASHTLKFKMGFPKKLLKLNIDRDPTGQNNEPFHAACDPRDAIWCVISISDPVSGDTTDMKQIMTRKIVYRDSQGTAA